METQSHDKAEGTHPKDEGLAGPAIGRLGDKSTTNINWITALAGENDTLVCFAGRIRDSRAHIMAWVLLYVQPTA